MTKRPVPIVLVLLLILAAVAVLVVKTRSAASSSADTPPPKSYARLGNQRLNTGSRAEGEFSENAIKNLLSATAGTPRAERYLHWQRSFARLCFNDAGQLDRDLASEVLRKTERLGSEGLVSTNAKYCRMGLFAAIADLDPERGWEWIKDNHESYRELFARSAWNVAKENQVAELGEFLDRFGSGREELRSVTLARVRDWVHDTRDLRLLGQLSVGLDPAKAREIIGNSLLGYYRRKSPAPSILDEIESLFPDTREIAQPIIEGAVARGNPEGYLNWHAERGKELTVRQCRFVASGFVRTSPQKGISWISTIADAQPQLEAASAFVRLSLDRDSFRAGEHAIELMNTLGPGQTSDAIAFEVAQFLLRKKDFDGAQPWVQRIKVDTLRTRLGIGQQQP